MPLPLAYTKTCTEGSLAVANVELVGEFDSVGEFKYSRVCDKGFWEMHALADASSTSIGPGSLRSEHDDDCMIPELIHMFGHCIFWVVPGDSLALAGLGWSKRIPGRRHCSTGFEEGRCTCVFSALQLRCLRSWHCR